MGLVTVVAKLFRRRAHRRDWRMGRLQSYSDVRQEGSARLPAFELSLDGI